MANDALPQITRKPQHALKDLKEHGLALIAEALAPDQLTTAHDRLMALARRERAAGSAFLEDGSASDGNYRKGNDQPNQRVLGLMGKDEVFAAIAQNPQTLDLIRALFAESYGLPDQVIHQYALNDVLLSSVSANIAGFGGKVMNLHADQGFAPNSTPYPIIVNAIYLLCDFTENNGATLIAPGSQDSGRHSSYYESAPSVYPVVAPAGSLLLFDGRTWHGTGANRTRSPRPALLATYCRPWVRQLENFALTLDDATLAGCSTSMLKLLGFDVWSVFGQAEAQRAAALPGPT